MTPENFFEGKTLDIVADISYIEYVAGIYKTKIEPLLKLNSFPGKYIKL